MNKSRDFRKTTTTKATVVHVNNFGIKVRLPDGEIARLKYEYPMTVLPGDQVQVKSKYQRRYGRDTWKVTEVKPIGRYRIVGVVGSHRSTGVKWLSPVGVAGIGEIEIEKIDKSISVGQFVVADVIRKPTGKSKNSQWFATRVKVLNSHQEIANEIALTRSGVHHEWPKEVSWELPGLPKIDVERTSEARKDLRALHFVTIDPPGAEDFDDAVYCESAKGKFRLFVAIADVSWFVRPHTAIDNQAAERGTSIYLSQSVVPMLPEKLSSDLCSLKPEEDRYALVCEMVVDKGGSIKDYQFYEAIICSKARLTYNQAKKFTGLNLEQATLQSLQNLVQVHECLLGARNDRNALDFEIPESVLEFRKSGEVKSCEPSSRNFAHRVVEECMLAANVCAAKLIQKHFPKGGMYRVHDVPPSSSVMELSRFLEGYGIEFPEHAPEVSEYSRVTEALINKPRLLQALQSHLLRSLEKAEYSVEAKPHYALNYPLYTHFTSPIRRYPDLLVHRMIKHILYQQDKAPELEFLKSMAKESSYLERRAESCWREATNWLKNTYMETRIGEVFDGLIVDVRHFGFFVQIQSPFVDGLVLVNELTSDYYVYNEIRRRLEGANTGRDYSIGNMVRVQVVDADAELGTTYFRPFKSSAKKGRKSARRR